MWIFLTIIIAFFIVIYTTVRLEVNEQMINSCEKIKKIKYIISIYLFKKIKIYSFKLTKDKIDKNNNISKMAYKNINKILRVILKTNNIKIEKLRLDLRIGTENAAFTSYGVAIISTIISIFISKKVNRFSDEKYKYSVIPIYTQKNIFNLSVNCIVCINLVHIIYMIYVLNGKDDKNGRTSNRRTYENNHGQYKRYDRCRYNYR